MSRHISIRNLQIITALDSLSYGLMYHFLAEYLKKLGGDPVSVGVLLVTTLIGELISPEVTKVFTYVNGNRYGLFLILCFSLLSHVMIAVTNSCRFAITMRFLFSSVNQTQNVCLALLLEREQNTSTIDKLHINYSVLSGSGYILGPIISGYLFEKEKGFRYISMISAFLTLINIVLLTTVHPQSDEVDYNYEDLEKSLLDVKQAFKGLSETVEEVKTSELEKHWDMLVLKYAFTSSFLVFLFHFPLLLEHNFENHVSSVTVGYIIAYVNTVIFASGHYVYEARAHIEEYPLMFVSEVAFVLLTVLLSLACFAPSYETFLVLLIPIIFLKTLLMTMWKDLFSERDNEALYKLRKPAGIAAGLTVPIMFGVTCNHLAHNKAVIVFTCAPILLCWLVIKFHSKLLKSEIPSAFEDDCFDSQGKVKYN